MNNVQSSSHTLSNIFFVSILIAAGVYAFAIALEGLSAGDLLPGSISLVILAFAVGATVILHIPNYFASNFSSTTISLLAIAVSIFGLLLTVPDAPSFANLPEGMLTSPGTQNLRIVSLIGVML